MRQLTLKPINKLSFFASFLLVGLLSSTSFGQEGGGYANIVVGLSVPDSSNTTKHSLYGFSGGAPLSPKFSIGGYHSLSSKENGPGNTPFSFTLTGLEGRLLITSGKKNVFLGFRAGVTKVNSSASGTEVTFSPYHFGIVSAYSFKVWGPMTLGFEGSFLKVAESSALSGTDSVTYASFHLINFFGTIGLSF